MLHIRIINKQSKDNTNMGNILLSYFTLDTQHQYCEDTDQKYYSTTIDTMTSLFALVTSLFALVTSYDKTIY